jgi:DNA-directed RNA polymerase alpha subunit
VNDLYEREEVKKDPLTEDIDALDFSQRVYHLLKRYGINTMRELLEFDDLKIPGIGPMALEEVDNKLEKIREEIEGEKWE